MWFEAATPGDRDMQASPHASAQMLCLCPLGGLLQGNGGPGLSGVWFQLGATPEASRLHLGHSQRCWANSRFSNYDSKWYGQTVFAVTALMPLWDMNCCWKDIWSVVESLGLRLAWKIRVLWRGETKKRVGLQTRLGRQSSKYLALWWCRASCSPWHCKTNKQKGSFLH